MLCFLSDKSQFVFFFLFYFCQTPPLTENVLFFFRKPEGCAANCQRNVCYNKVDVTHTHARAHTHLIKGGRHRPVMLYSSELGSALEDELCCKREEEKRGNPFVPRLLFTFIHQFILPEALSVRAVG